MLRSQVSLSGFVLIAALMLSGGSASAEKDAKSANYMMPGCRHSIQENDNANSFLQGWCGGLITGLSYTSTEICTPPGVTPMQLARVVVQYIDARPARMHENFKELALEAMKAAWPCQR